MSSSAIECLPSKILLQICRWLKIAHPTSIYGFSQTSKKVREVANIVIFRHVILLIRDLNNVNEDVQSLRDALEPISALGHIRRLRLCHAWTSPGADQKSRRGDPAHVLSRLDPSSRGSANDEAWSSVADLLQQCSGLVSLLYELNNQLQPCVLEALHRHRPNCQLHMRTFCCPTLMGPEKDKHELAIASSPSLHSIWFTSMSQKEDERAAKSNEIVQKVLTELAPNVEEVRFIQTKMVPHGSRELETRSLMEKSRLRPYSRLRHLELSSERCLFSISSERVLEGWHAHVDFSRLHTLTLKSRLCTNALRWLSQCDFRSLKALYFQPRAPCRSNSRNHTVESLVESFIIGIPPLRTMIIENGQFQDVDAVCQRHGASSRVLRLSMCLYTIAADSVSAAGAIPVIEKLRNHCPLLADLDICLPRARGDATETAMYKRFATFPSLRRLTDEPGRGRL